ncbi:MAG: hypothetical protein D8M61_15450 [Ignavibacteriae bacterium]|nr:hypothetical protein [Ignavibacteriota bacterium]
MLFTFQTKLQKAMSLLWSFVGLYNYVSIKISSLRDYRQKIINDFSPPAVKAGLKIFDLRYMTA